MATRFYILPTEDNNGWTGPKYIAWGFDPDPPGIDCRWSLKDYGLIPACLVAADVTQEQHEQLAAEADVAAPPADIDQNVSAPALPAVQQVLEALSIPARWVTTGHTYRELLRMVGGLCMFAQRHHALHGERLIDSPAQLDLSWSQVPAARRARIQATADSMGYDYSAVLPSWTVRHALKLLAGQWGETPIHFGFATL